MNIEEIFESINEDELISLLKKRVRMNVDPEFSYKEITPVGGFDTSDLVNGKQNNYAWSMCDFDGYIYVGTGRNILYEGSKGILGDIDTPIDIAPEYDQVDNRAEIWRYKKDGSQPWKRVFKSEYISFTNPETREPIEVPDIIGFRALAKYKSFGLKPAMYAAAYSLAGVKVLKTIDGANWFEIPTNITEGTSSRCILEYKGKLYMAVINDSTEEEPALIYSSSDPELFGWTKVTGDGEEGKNPVGAVWSMLEYNDRLYVGTAGADGFMIWRTNGEEPRINDWTLVMDKGGGDAKNAVPLTLSIFNDYLYVGTACNTYTVLPHIIPMGAELFRIDKEDHWELVVGGLPIMPTNPTTGSRTSPIGNSIQGFGNPYNLYIWQMVSYKGKFYVGTFDSSVNVEPMLELLIKNRALAEERFGTVLVQHAIAILKLQVAILSKFPMLQGFDLLVSEDGVNFKPVNINGFGNRYNYGVRNLLISDNYSLYLGTANPYQGCEVFKIKGKPSC